MEPKGFLKDNDVVEVELDGFGALRNKIVFDQGSSLKLVHS